MKMLCIMYVRLVGLLCMVAIVFTVNSTAGQGSRYIGCFYDRSSPPTNRALPDLTSCLASTFCDNFCSVNIPYCESARNMSVTNCVSLCSRQNHFYAGLQAGRQCFCGRQSAVFDRYGQEMDETRCKSNCSGDVTQACGSDLRMEVYEIGCMPPAALPPNTTVSPANKMFFEIGQTISISCQEGFLINQTILTCLPQGDWSLLPLSCIPDVCEPPDPPPGTTARGNTSQENTGFYRGDTLLFECLSDGDTTVNVSCLEGEWHTTGSCPVESTVIMTSVITEDLTSESLVETTQSEITSTHLMTTSDEKVITTSVQSTKELIDDTSTPSPGDEKTTTPSMGSVRSAMLDMVWLIIILGAAMLLFVVILFFAVIFACRKKTDRNGLRPSDDHLQIPKIDNISHVNYAYEETEQPRQNGHPISGSTLETTNHSQEENSTENNNLNHHEYAKPATPPYANQSRKEYNEYASPVNRHSNNNEMVEVSKKSKRVTYSPDIPEPDYESTRRESYVEMVTKL